MSAFESWEQFCGWLDSLGMFHMELGLDRMREALARLDHPESGYAIIQVLGTNGKGSTATYLSALAAAHDLPCGLYTSPHFVSPQERLLLNGRQAEKDLWLKAANLIRQKCADLSLTYFEFVTLVATLIFKWAGMRLAIIEAGLGGRNDATTALGASCQCFTAIALDHAHVIGPTLEHIASDKCAAIKAASSVFSTRQYPAVQRILQDKAGKEQLTFVEADLALKTALAGESQKRNAALALATWRYQAAKMGLASDPEKEKTALAKAFIPGRLQMVRNRAGQTALVLDGAHNPHAMWHILQNYPGPEPGLIVFSALADKNWPICLGLLMRAFKSVPLLVPQLDNPRAASAKLIAMQASKINPASSPLVLQGSDAVAEAMHLARENFAKNGKACLVTGSLYLLAEVFTLYPQLLEADALIDWPKRLR